MPDDRNPDPVTGKTIRFTWTQGPTKGETHEHVFNADGSVDYRKVDKGAAGGKMTHEKKYAALRVRDPVYLVSYLASSGFTLTVAIDFESETLAGFASNDKQWFPLKGTVEVVDR
jgi:phenolic acid decarboxylase